MPSILLAGERSALPEPQFGIATPEDAWQRILAGATLIQAYTGFVFGGPLWPRHINRGLERHLRESPWSTLEEAVGKGTS